MDHRPWHDCYDEGIPSSLTYPAVPLFHFLENSAKKYPDKPCTIFKGAEISYKEMSKITDQLAAALVDLGVKKGRPGRNPDPKYTPVCDGIFRCIKSRRYSRRNKSSIHRKRNQAPGK